MAKVAKTGKHVRFQDLRRTAVSLMRDLGVTEGDISATTGHSIATKRRSGNKMETSPPSATPCEKGIYDGIRRLPCNGGGFGIK